MKKGNTAECMKHMDEAHKAMGLWAALAGAAVCHTGSPPAWTRIIGTCWASGRIRANIRLNDMLISLEGKVALVIVTDEVSQEQ